MERVEIHVEIGVQSHGKRGEREGMGREWGKGYQSTLLLLSLLLLL